MPTDAYCMGRESYGNHKSDPQGIPPKTWREARSTIEGMGEKVKDTMEDTTTMVTRSSDLHYHVDQHPWVLLSGAVVMGVRARWTRHEEHRGVVPTRSCLDRDRGKAQGGFRHHHLPSCRESTGLLSPAPAADIRSLEECRGSVQGRV
jgi:hypothetical protein